MLSKACGVHQPALDQFGGLSPESLLLFEETGTVITYLSRLAKGINLTNYAGKFLFVLYAKVTFDNKDGEIKPSSSSSSVPGPFPHLVGLGPSVVRMATDAAPRWITPASRPAPKA
ncbi:jg7271 [Pararge aegeria aegeria]|uniref:Jg7271 protein n=1 Tax=Pararge aegeria aegeria TaxID=348720 RepID=A0A8S4S605_9NEOP|nr:jg7271 [Pararge aegeria aegeria]